jgi:hypothetical protein
MTRRKHLVLATLHSLPGEPLHPPVHERALWIASAAETHGLTARQELIAERLLTSVHEDTLDIELGAAASSGKPRLDASNPFLTDAERTLLDERGIVRRGSILKPGNVLVSIVRPTGDPRAPSMQDDSARCTDVWAGMRVVAVDHYVRQGKTPEDGSERVVLALRREADLQAGDVLLHAGRSLGSVAEITPDQRMPAVASGRHADLVVPSSVARRLGISEPVCRPVSKLGRCGQAAVMIQVTGPYSLITQIPLGKQFGRAQGVGTAQVGWLRTHGFQALLGELVSLKADDLKNRRRIRYKIDKAPPPAAPESLFLWRAELMGLGFDVRLRTQGDHVSVQIRPATAEEILGWSNGEVRKPETLNYRTYRPEPGGIFCPTIFGPEETRRIRRFGHFRLSAPIIPFYWQCGSPSILEQLLKLPAVDIGRILSYAWRIERSDGALSFADPSSPVAYGMENLGMGAEAILALLREVQVERLPPALVGRTEALVQTLIPIIPADYRPIVLLESGNFATSDLNDHYRRVINRSNRLAKLLDLKAPETIIWNEQHMLQQTADGLYMNCFLPRKKRVMGTNKRPLVDMMSMALGRLLDMSSKRVDWCGRARPAVFSAPDPKHLLVPRRMFEALQLHEDQPALLTRLKDKQGRFVALLPRPHEGECFGISLQAARDLGLSPWYAGSCVLHRPLSQAAQAEAGVLVAGDAGISAQPPGKRAWVDGSDQRALLSGLIAAALSGEEVALDSPRGLLIGGTGSLEGPGEEELVREG